ncbi:MAG TPA: trigger factor [Clostridia bacterium]|nr:trigger factor [Clostridia bacterium]
MEYTTTNRTGNSIVLSATFTADEVSAMRHEATLAMAGKLRIPGFRPGKAPLSIVAKYVSDEELKDDVLQKAASQTYVTFLKEHKDTDALIFEPEIVEAAPEDSPTDGLKVDIRVFEMPKADREFWSTVEVEDVPVDTARAVQSRINALVDAVTETSPKDGPAAQGDSVTVTISTERSKAPHHTEFTLGEGEVGKAYEPFVVGMNVGESKHFSVQMQESALEGEVTLEGVAMKHVPEVNDDFARTVGAFESLEQLRKTLEEDEQHKADEARKDAVFGRAIEKAAEKLGIDFPGYVLRDATEERLGEIKNSLARNGLSLNEYLKYNDITVEQLTKDVEADAVKLLRRDLLMEATERACSIVAGDADIDAYSESHKEELAKANVDTTTEDGRKTVRNVIVWDNTRSLIVSAVQLAMTPEGKREAQ